MKIKRSGWIPLGSEADSANRILSGNAARLFSYLYFRADRPGGQLNLRYDDAANWLGRKKRLLVKDFDELREKSICQVDSPVNQYTLVHVQICDMFWPFATAKPEQSDIEVEYLSQVRALLEARACVRCDFGPPDQKFARDLFARGIPIVQIEMAISLGCSRKYASLLNGTDNGLIFRLAYFRDLIAEASEADPEHWKNIGNPLLTKMEAKWLTAQKSALQNSVQARRKGEKETR